VISLITITSKDCTAIAYFHINVIIIAITTIRPPLRQLIRNGLDGITRIGDWRNSYFVWYTYNEANEYNKLKNAQNRRKLIIISTYKKIREI